MQNKSVYEVFGAQGTLSEIGASHVKMTRRTYDKVVRGSVLTCEGDLTRLMLPKSSKVPCLRLQHPVLAFQLYTPVGLSCLEVIVEDTGPIPSRKKISFGTHRKKATYKNDVAKLPLTLPTNSWVLICINLPCLLAKCFGPSCEFKSIERLSLGSWCSLKRILALKNPIPPSYEPGDGFLPKSLDFPAGVSCQVVQLPHNSLYVYPIQDVGECGDAIDEFVEDNDLRIQPAPIAVKGPPPESSTITIHPYIPSPLVLRSEPLRRAESTPHTHRHDRYGPFNYPHHSADADLRRPASACGKPVIRQHPPVERESHDLFGGWLEDPPLKPSICNFSIKDWSKKPQPRSDHDDDLQWCDHYWGCHDRWSADTLSYPQSESCTE